MNDSTEHRPATAGQQHTDSRTPAAPMPAVAHKPRLALWEIALVVGAVLAMVAVFVYQLDRTRVAAARSFDLQGRLVQQYLGGRLDAARALAAQLRPAQGAARAANAAHTGGSVAGPAAAGRQGAAAHVLDAPAAALLARDSDVLAVTYLAEGLAYRFGREAQAATFSEALYAEPAWTQGAPARNPGGQAVVAGLREGADGLRVQVAAPVVADGVFQGVVALELDPALLQDLMAREDAPGDIILVDGQGQLIARAGALRRDEHYPVPASGINLWEDSAGTSWAAMVLDDGRLYLLQRLSLWQHLGIALARTLPVGLLFVLGACAVVLGLRLRDALHAVAQQDRRDPLTRALNRRGLFEDVVPLHAVARRNRKGLAVLTLDVDFFRQLNEQFGHHAGDRVLCALTTGLREHVREYDVIARWSGEIFVVVLMVEHDADALPLAERLRAMAAATVQRDALLTVSVSAGLAMWAADEAIEAAVGRSEQMLYAAKAAGRDRLQAAADVVRPVYAPSGEQVSAGAAPVAGPQARG